jgi:hypothetical protein
MALSGSYDFNLTAEEIVKEAFKEIGVNPAEQDLQAFEINDGLIKLNLLIKRYQSQGLHLWTKTEGILFQDKSKTDYLVGPNGDNAANFDDFVGATLVADESTAATVLDVSSTAGMAVGDIAGVQLDDGTRFWTTIIAPVLAASITVADALPSAAATGNTVFTYTSKPQRPLRVLSSRRQTYGENNEVQILPWSRDQYFNQVDKSSQGTAVNFYYDPQLDNGRFYVWQTASSVNDFVRFTYEAPLQDVDLSTDNVQFPVEWLEALIYNLALRLANSFNAPAAKVQLIIGMAQSALDDALSYDMEMESLNIQPDFN